MAVSPLPAQPAIGGGDAIQAGDRPVLRDDPSLGAQVRASLRPEAAAKPTRPGDIWHLDEVRIVIAGRPHWLWQAVDQDGSVLDEILQTRRIRKRPNA